jgi:predicted ATPase/DNA-binding SARP family transcriptional activator
MPSALRARFLGRPAFERDGKALACASRKAMWLASYVLFTRMAHPRARLASLIWGGESPRHAQGSLRVVLTKLPRPVAAALEVTRDEIGPARDAAVETDVDEFLAASMREDEQGLRRVIALYSGDLFEGAEADAAAEFCDWLLPERARLRTLAHDAHLRLAQDLLARGERDGARELAEAWLRRDPAAEEMHKLMMLVLGPDQALAHYDLYRRARAVALGAAPSEAMGALAERLRHGGDAQPLDVPARLTAATSFFGRTEELAELRGLLADPSCRLLTLHGLGGVGKTRLAGTLADLESSSFPDGIHVVALEGLPSPRLFASTLARACGLQPSGAASPLQLAASFLRDSACLVVLDNLEHLIGTDDAQADSLAAQVGELLRDTGPRLKVLATSREPLRLQEEWLYGLEGLAHPRAAAANGDAQSYPAVQFFAQRARQAYVGFSVSAELPNVVQICELLEGLPLGLELAASWVRTVPCAEIAASLRTRAAELRNRHVNRDARHDSLGAVVAYSWDRLAPEQREALAGLAVFAGDFSREAAERIALAGVRTLSSLTEKSLLQRAHGGRWRLHEVVRQFAWQQPDERSRPRAARQSAVIRRRDAYYIEWLESMRARIEGPEEAEALDALEEEVANLRATWNSCARAGDAASLARVAPAWLAFLESRGFVSEGCNAAAEWLAAAAESSTPHPSAERARATLGHFEQFATNLTRSIEILDACVAALEPPGESPDLAFAITERALTLSHLGRLVDAEQVSSRAIAMAGGLGDERLLAQALTVRGIIVVRSGKGEEARELQRRALAIVSRAGNPSLVARVQNNLALAQNYLGDYRAAEAGYSGALALWKDLRATRNMGLATHNLGVVAERMGNFALALERYREALELFKRVGDRKMIAINLISTGDSLVRIGRPAEARAPLEEAIRIATRDEHSIPVAYAHVMLAHAAVTLGESGEAADEIDRAFHAAERGNFTDVQAEAVVGVARLVAAAAPAFAPQALAWMLAMANLPKASSRVRDDANHLIGVFSARAIEPAQARGAALEDLVAEARELLARLNPSRAPRSRAASSARAATRA